VVPFLPEYGLGVAGPTIRLRSRCTTQFPGCPPGLWTRSCGSSPFLAFFGAKFPWSVVLLTVRGGTRAVAADPIEHESRGPYRFCRCSLPRTPPQRTTPAPAPFIRSSRLTQFYLEARSVFFPPLGGVFRHRCSSFSVEHFSPPSVLVPA